MVEKMKKSLLWCLVCLVCLVPCSGAALAAEAEKIRFLCQKRGLGAHARSALVRKDKGVIQ